ncbi:MAG: ABC transporter substrate-binding protein [Deltaproteobacteria bacterium]|nr:ABC transporter substrate-binding protein [Deltaproteobacteria bacterium]
MKFGYFKTLAPLIVLAVFGSWLAGSSAPAASATPALLKAKQEAEAKGHIFEISHDDILAKAKKEGRLKVFASLDAPTIKGLNAAFRKKYPFIDAHAEEIAGTDTYQRMILEMKSGTAKGWDVNYLTTDFYDEYLPHLKKFDIVGMAQHRVLQISLEMVNPIDRNIVALSTNVQVVAYNKKVIPTEKVPNAWEDFLKPEFMGRKFVADIRPTEIAALVPAWGLEKTLDFSRKLAAQKPVWVRGHSRVIAAMGGGEYAMLIGSNLKTIKNAIDKNPTGGLDFKVLEPVPVRLSEHEGIFVKADHPYAGLLWLEFAATPEAQKIMDGGGNYDASAFSPGTVSNEAIRGRKLSLVDWQHATKLQDYQKKVVEAYGFPQAERRK